MGNKISLFIEIDDTDYGVCSDSCPFMTRSKCGCTLFNSELEDTELLEGHVWNGREPTKTRCDLCLCVH